MDKFNKLSSVEFSDFIFDDWSKNYHIDVYSIYIKEILKTNCKWEEGKGVKGK